MEQQQEQHAIAGQSAGAASVPAADAAAGDQRNIDDAGQQQQQQKEAAQRAHCAAIKTEFQDLLAEFCDALSDADFAPLFESLRNTDNTLTGSGYLDEFRAKLADTLREDHEQFWQNNYVDDGLSCLHEVVQSSISSSAKQQAANGTAAAGGGENGGDGGGGGAVSWRPSGKSAAEQVRFYRMFLMRAKIAYLQKHTASKQSKMQQMIVQLESRRSRMEEQQARRRALEAQMGLRDAELDTAGESLRSLQMQLNDREQSY